MRFGMALTALVTASMAVAGCADQKPITEEELQRPVEPPALPSQNQGNTDETTSASDQTEEGDTADNEQAEGPELEAITFADVVDIVDPGLGCSFINTEDESLLFATGEDGESSPIEGAAKIGGTMVPLAGTGGYSGLQEGTTLTSEALELTITREEGEGKKVGVETMEWPATLTVSQDEGGTTTYEGRYSCGA